MKQNYFPEFQIVKGATFWDFQLFAPRKFNLWQASGQLLISNTANIMHTLFKWMKNSHNLQVMTENMG